MARQAAIDFEVETAQPVMLRNTLPCPECALYIAEATALAREMEFDCEAGSEEGNCLKGLLVAISLEAVAALSIFGAWKFWHLLR